MWSRGIRYKRNLKRKLKCIKDNPYSSYCKYYICDKGYLKLKTENRRIIKELKFYKNYIKRCYRREKINLDDTGFKSNYIHRKGKYNYWYLIY